MTISNMVFSEVSKMKEGSSITVWFGKEIDINSVPDKSDTPPPKKDTKKSYGEYGRIKLTDKQYEKLCEDYDKLFIDNQIKLLDEYVESNNNKNKYSNFNLVLRKSINENWFKSKQLKQHETKTFSNPFMEALKGMSENE